MMKIRWSQTSQDDLEEIANLDIIQSIIRSTNRLVDYPLSGRQGRIEGTREIVNISYPYIVAYRVFPDHVQISRIIHTSRLFPEEL